MLITLNLVTVIASTLFLAILLIKQKYVPTVTIAFSLVATSQSLGYFLLAIATTTEMGWFATLLIYVGGCFCPLLFLILITKLSKTKLPKWLFIALGIYAAVIFSFVLSIKFSPVYYKNFHIVVGKHFSYLEKEYGPAHLLFIIYMLISFYLVAYVIFSSIKRSDQISLSLIVPPAALTLLIFAAYFAGEIFRLKVNIVPIFYLLNLLYLIKITSRMTIFNLPTNIVNCIEQGQDNGYLEFDNKYRCVVYNKKIEEIFPEIKNIWKVDKKLEENNSFFYKEIYSWLISSDKTQKKTIKVNHMYYEMRIHEIPKITRGCAGYIIELLDRTMENIYLKAVENYSHDLKEEVNKQTEHITDMKDKMVLSMASLVESRDNSTGGHIKRTSDIMKVFSDYLLENNDELNFSPDFLHKVTKAAPMHDLGKIAVSDAILCKKGLYTEDEYDEMKKHSYSGAEIVDELLTGVEDEDFVKIAKNVAHYHHERWDGKGYPNGLKGNDIPIEARLMSLVDVFDALVSKRCYKESYSFDKAFDIIKDSLGSQFDPVLGQLFINCRDNLEVLYSSWTEKDL